MTLITTIGVGQTACVISGDTRRVLEMSGKTILLPDTETKVHKISEHFIAAGGGYNAIHEYVIEELQKVNSNSGEEIHNRLIEIAEKVPVEFEDAFKLHKDIFFVVQVVGFDEESGNLCKISYDIDGGVNASVARPKEVGGSIIAPGDYSKAYTRVGDVKDAIKDIDGSSMTVTEDLINYSMNFQQELLQDYPNEISNTFCFYALTMWNGKVLHVKGKKELN